MNLRASATGVVLAALCLLCAPARAQLLGGRIQGQVLDASRRPVGGATVVVSGPALQADQIEVTGPDGRFLITALPPGDGYAVRAYFGDGLAEQPGVRVAHGKTLGVLLRLPADRAGPAHQIRERAPNVDVAASDVRLELNEEVLRDTPVRGRTFESVLGLAPGASNVAPWLAPGGDAGVSFLGSTGAENQYLIDGLNTSDPGLNLVGTQLHQYFIKEVQILSGGYQAEHGRATGGIVSVVTQSGGDRPHGSVFGSWSPVQLTPRTLGRFGEAIGRRRYEQLDSDVGADFSGPLFRDRVRFYLGFVATLNPFQTDRVVRALVPDPADRRRAQVDPDFSCPGYLAWDGYCDGPRLLALRTEEVDQKAFFEPRYRYNILGKLDFNLSPDHHLTLTYLGSPETQDGYRRLRADAPGSAYSNVSSIHDLGLRYSGKLLSHRLQIDAAFGYHHQDQDTRPQRPEGYAIWYRASPTNPYSLADLEDAPRCARDPATGFNPCPITSYTRNGYAQYNHPILRRESLQGSVTYLLDLFGRHLLKLGADLELAQDANLERFTGPPLDPSTPNLGPRFYQTNADGTRLMWAGQFAQRNPDGGPPIQLDRFEARAGLNNYALYLRDSWAVGPLPGLVLNLGLRWEAQELYGEDGQKRLTIYDNLAPRLGAVYDFTRAGRSRLYFNYGRFYESIPLLLAESRFVSAGFLRSGYTDNCASRVLQPGGRALPVPEAGPGRPCTFPPGPLSNSSYAEVAPDLQGQYINEIVLGAEYDVGLDLVLGVGFVHRDLGNIVEDMSIDAGQTFLIANPGREPDPGALAELTGEAARLAALAAQRPGDAELGAQAAAARSRAENYRLLGKVYPAARRDYNAVTFTINKRLSSRFSLLASYTYSRTIGNYPGTFAANSGDIYPNISTQWNFIDLLANRMGPLPTDRPHNFKLTGAYVQPLGRFGTLSAGLTFTAISGRPIEVLGYHPAYAELEVFVLPRGSGGRTPAVTQLDLHLGYEYPFSERIRLRVFCDVLNALNQLQVTNVDDEYTGSTVGPILNGRPEDLRFLKSLDGSPIVPNSNYGQPTAYQAPLSMRLGARLMF